MRTQVDTSTLEMALIGYRSQLIEITAKMESIRKRLGGRATKGGGGGEILSERKHVMSTAGRKAIAAAQRKRWAAYRKLNTGAKEVPPKRRILSPEAKAKLAANLAKARAARAANAEAAGA